MRQNFFKGKSVLITGNTGFVGSWLTLWLDELGADITGFSLLPPSKPYHYGFLEFRSKVTDIRGDIRKISAISKAVRDHEPEIIFHLAAQPILLCSYKKPVETYVTNAIGTLNLLESCRKFGKTNVVVNVTTDKVYANTGKMRAYKEDDKLGSNNDPYSTSKACSELITQAYYQSLLSDMGVATARAGNIMGGGDWGRYRIIPDLVYSDQNGRMVTLRNPDAIRPWTYIFDVLNGYLTLGEKLYENPARYSGAWNFGPDSIKTVEGLVSEFSKYLKIKYKTGKGKLHEDKIILLDSTKSRKELEWKPKVDFNSAVKETAEWYSYFYNNRNKENITRYSLKQLDSFRKRLHG